MWTRLVLIYMLYYLGKIDRHCCAHRKYFLRESLEMIGIWIPLSRVFACYKRFCSCKFMSRVRRLLFPLNSRVKMFASMNTNNNDEHKQQRTNVANLFLTSKVPYGFRQYILWKIVFFVLYEYKLPVSIATVVKICEIS